MYNKVKEFRLRAGLSQEKLAQRADLSRQTVVKLEKDPSYPADVFTFVKIAKALGCTVDDIIIFG